MTSGPWVVLIKHGSERDMHLYSTVASDETDAIRQVTLQFIEDHSPDDMNDWSVIGFKLSFSGKPHHIGRLDNAL